MVREGAQVASPQSVVFEDQVGDRFVYLWRERDRVLGRVFDPDAPAWRTVSEAPEGTVARLSTHAIGDRLVFLWATTHSVAGAVLDVASGQWTRIAGDGPAAIEPALTVTTPRSIIVFEPMGRAFVYDAAANRWRAVSTTGMPALRPGAVVAASDRYLMVWGGVRSEFHRGAADPTRVPVRDGAVYDVGAGVWKRLSDSGAPPPMRDQVVHSFASGDRLYVIAPPHVHVLDPGAARWSVIDGAPVEPSSRFYKVGDRLLSVTGRAAAVFDPTAGRWSFAGTAPVDVSDHRHRVIDSDRVLFHHGPTSDSPGAFAVLLDASAGRWCALRTPNDFALTPRSPFSGARLATSFVAHDSVYSWLRVDFTTGDEQKSSYSNEGYVIELSRR